MTVKRPIRLWVVCGLNIFAAGISLLAVVFLAVSDDVPADVKPDLQDLVFGATLATFLIVSSVLAFFRIRHSRWLAFLAAMLFYGALVAQQAVFLVQLTDTLSEQQRLRVVASMTRSGLELLFNAWALFSAKTSRYFGAAIPQPPVPAPPGDT